MGINVNFYDEVVYITSPTTAVTVQELVDAVRVAEDSKPGIGFDSVIDTVGKDDLGGGAKTAITMILNINWYIEFWYGVDKGIVSGGNVVGGKDDIPIRAAISSTDTVLVLSAVGGVISGSGLSTEQNTQLMKTLTIAKYLGLK